VAPHVATNPNGTQRDNYSAIGNENPYTGAVGTRNPRYWHGKAVEEKADLHAASATAAPSVEG